MDEYEVDLRDYLVVIWERKWIIVGVTLAAIAIAVVYTFRLPNEYRAQALIRYEPGPPLNSVRLEGTPAVGTVAELMRRSGLWRRAVAMHPDDAVLEERSPDRLAAYLAQGLQVEPIGESSYLELRLDRPMDPTSLGRWLGQYLQAAQAMIREPIEAQMQDQVRSLEERETFLRGRRSELLDAMTRWIDLRLSELRTQRQDLTERLDELLGRREAGGGDDVVQGNILQQSYGTLASRLEAIESEIIRLETERQSDFPRPGSGLDGQLNRVQSELDDLVMEVHLLQRAMETDWAPLNVVNEASASDSPVGPERKLNVAIAGVLGLFIGLLLAFFVHYVSTAPRESIRRSAESES